MKTLRFSGIACVMTLALSACGGDDSPLSALMRTNDADTETEGEGTAPAEASNTPRSEALPTDVEMTAASPDAELAPTERDPNPELDLDAELATPSDAGPVRAEITWRNCGQFEDRNLQCAEVVVPVDYEQLEGEQLSIALRRIQANPLEPYHGALLFNPGGPGGEGIDITLSLFEGEIFDTIAPGYDIIGFDPRGVGASGETGCGILPEDLYPGATPTATQVGFADVVAYFRAEGERCEAQWGPLFRKLGSNNVVRDIEEIRKALNEPVLNFYGASYGTRLGALYAHRYPETTGRIVLDAAVQPRASLVQMVRGQFTQAIALHELFLSGCESGAQTCPPDARLVFDQILANARTRGLDGALLVAWTDLLLDLNGLATLQQMLAAEAADPGGEWIVGFFGSSGGGGSTGLSNTVNRSVHCTDDAFEPPTLEELETLAAEFSELSPVFANTFLPSAAICAGWPVTRDPVPMPTATNAQPLLVIGGTADGLTPYDWSRQMTEAVGSATLLTSNHYGHAAIGRGGDCVKAVIRAYLTSGSLPATGATCS